MTYIGKDAPPFLIMHGLADGSVPHGQSAMLYDALKSAGHDVTLFASGDSHTKATLSSVFPTAPSARIGQTLPELQFTVTPFTEIEDEP